MPYAKQTWTDEVPVSTPVRYKISESTDGDITPDAKIEPVTSVTAGSPVNAERLNYMEDGIETAQATAETAQETADAAKNASIAWINKLTLQSIPNNTYTAIQFATETLDTDAYWSVGVPTRIIAPYRGVYLVTFYGGWDTNLTGYRTITIRKNGSTTDEFGQIFAPVSGVSAIHEFATILYMNASEYFEVLVMQTSGGSLNVNGRVQIALLGKIP